MTIRAQLIAWGVNIDALLDTELEMERGEVPPEGSRAVAWVQEFGREVLRRRTVRGPLAERHQAERDALAERQRLERLQQREVGS
jgi:phage FluMu protein gp41